MIAMAGSNLRVSWSAGAIFSQHPPRQLNKENERGRSTHSPTSAPNDDQRTTHEGRKIKPREVRPTVKKFRLRPVTLRLLRRTPGRPGNTYSGLRTQLKRQRNHQFRCSPCANQHQPPCLDRRSRNLCRAGQSDNATEVLCRRP